MKTPVTQFLGLVVSLVICFGVAAGASAVTRPAIQSGWYDTLRKPPWNPPASVFGPVWTLLYASMAVAAWLIWRRGEWRDAAGPLLIFAVQLALNGVWSGLFFAHHNPGAAFADIVLLWLAIVATILSFWPREPVAGWLLLPYLGWVTFAAALNFKIWRMNA